jgi:hypothetical protein
MDDAIAQYLELTDDDRAALVLPLHYSYGLSVLHSHLAVGASLWMHLGSMRALGFLDSFAKAGCTNLAGVPHTYELLESIDFRDHPLPNLRRMTAAGAGRRCSWTSSSCGSGRVRAYSCPPR